MCCRVTVAFGALKGFSSPEFRVVESAAARSIAPLRTSNKLRTSPISSQKFQTFYSESPICSSATNVCNVKSDLYIILVSFG